MTTIRNALVKLQDLILELDGEGNATKEDLAWLPKIDELFKAPKGVWMAYEIDSSGPDGIWWEAYEATDPSGGDLGYGIGDCVVNTRNFEDLLSRARQAGVRLVIHTQEWNEETNHSANMADTPGEGQAVGEIRQFPVKQDKRAALAQFVDASRALGCEHALMVRALESYGLDKSLIDWASDYYLSS